MTFQTSRISLLAVMLAIMMASSLFADTVTAKGEIVSIDATNRKVTVKRMTSKGEKNGDFVVSKKASISIGNELADFDELETGQSVSLTFDTKANEVVSIKVDSSTTTEKGDKSAESTTVTGKVTGVSKNSITLGDLELDVTKKTKVTIDGNAVSIDKIMTGQTAKVVFNEELAVALSVSVGDDPDHDLVAAKALKAMQGEWRCIEGEENGVVQDKTTVKKENRRITIKGNSLTMERIQGGKLGTYTGKFEIDSSNGYFDWIGKREPGNDTVEFIGIYKLDGDTLKLCYRYQIDDMAKRPKSFKTSSPTRPGLAHVYYKYKRDVE